MKKRAPGRSRQVMDLPLDVRTQDKAKADKAPCVESGRLAVYRPDGRNVERFLALLKKRMNRKLAVSLTGCVHCGLCADSCHYAIVFPDDPQMTPVAKADRIRKVFKRHMDWMGRIVPWWVGAKRPQDDNDLNELKNVVFGLCSGCRRCTFSCPMGVDTAGLIRFTRGLLTELGIVPEGIFNVSRDQWDTGNQMAVSEADYLETLAWMRDEARAELGNRMRWTSRSTRKAATSSTPSTRARSSSTRAPSGRRPRSSTWPASPGPCPAGAGTTPASGSSRAMTPWGLSWPRTPTRPPSD